MWAQCNQKRPYKKEVGGSELIVEDVIKEAAVERMRRGQEPRNGCSF